jgi:L-arabinonolactonase
MTYSIECVLECANHLGESPIWDVEEGHLYWVDGTGRRVGNPAIWRMDPKSGRVENWRLDRDVGAMVLRHDGGAALALDDGFYFFDFTSGKIDLIGRVETDGSRVRLNDGKCDSRGRFFAGGMDDKEELKICGLWRLDTDLSITKVDDGIICSNGPCWSPDDKPSISPIRSKTKSGLTTTTFKLARRRHAACSPARATTWVLPTDRPSIRRAICGTRN